MDDRVVGLHDEIGRMLSFDDGAVVVVEETEAAGIVDDIVVGGGAGVRWIYICGGIGHGVFAPIHEDASVAHVGGSRVCDGHCFRDALILEMVDQMDIRSSDEGGKCAEVRSHVRILEFLDGGHGELVVVSKG